MTAAKGKKEALLQLEKFLEKAINVKFVGGREVTGVLKGFDSVLDQPVQTFLPALRRYFDGTPPASAMSVSLSRLDDPYKRRLVEDPNDKNTLVEETRYLGCVVLRGTAVMVVTPYDGTEEFVNNHFPGGM
eukprot:gene10241-271_t